MSRRKSGSLIRSTSGYDKSEETQFRPADLAPAALDLAAQEWLKNRNGDADDAARQQRLQRAAAACFGKFAGGNPRRADPVNPASRNCGTK